MIDVYVDGLPIDIGRQGENLARNVCFDLSELISTYGEGTATLVYVRPSERAPYVCTTVRTGTFLIWSPTSTDTAYSGVGRCELRWVVGETLAKSIVYNTSIAPSIMQAGQIPDPYLSWYDAMMDYIENNYADGGVPSTVKTAIFTLLSKAAYTETGLTDELATVEAWTNPECTGLTLNPASMSFDTVSAQMITAIRRPADCTQEVTWTSSDQTVATVTVMADSTNALVSALRDGTCTITATCGNQTATCAVTVYGASVRRNITYNLTNVLSSNINWEVLDGSAYTTTLTGETGYVVGDVLVMMSGVDITDTVYSDGVITIPSVTGNVIITASGVAEVTSLSAVYTQSDVICDIDSLDILKSDLVVTATYSDSTTATVPSSDYTLSGTLEAGTSTITVLYGGATTTFNVTVNETLSVMTSPTTMHPSNNLASWDSSTETGEIHETSSTAGWTNLVLQGLRYKRSDVATKKMRVECDLVLSGIPSDTTTQGVLLVAGLFTSANPTNSGTQRKASASLDAVVGDGTHHYSYTDDIATLFPDTAMNNYYLGISIFLNQASPAAVAVSNLRMVVY